MVELLRALDTDEGSARCSPHAAATMSVRTMCASRGAHEERARRVASAGKRTERGFADAI